MWLWKAFSNCKPCSKGTSCKTSSESTKTQKQLFCKRQHYHHIYKLPSVEEKLELQTLLEGCRPGHLPTSCQTLNELEITNSTKQNSSNNLPAFADVYLKRYTHTTDEEISMHSVPSQRTNYCIVDKRTPSLRGEVFGADTTGPAVARDGTAHMISATYGTVIQKPCYTGDYGCSVLGVTYAPQSRQNRVYSCKLPGTGWITPVPGVSTQLGHFLQSRSPSVENGRF